MNVVFRLLFVTSLCLSTSAWAGSEDPGEILEELQLEETVLEIHPEIDPDLRKDFEEDLRNKAEHQRQVEFQLEKETLESEFNRLKKHINKTLEVICELLEQKRGGESLIVRSANHLQALLAIVDSREYSVQEKKNHLKALRADVRITMNELKPAPKSGSLPRSIADGLAEINARRINPRIVELLKNYFQTQAETGKLFKVGVGLGALFGGEVSFGGGVLQDALGRKRPMVVPGAMGGLQVGASVSFKGARFNVEKKKRTVVRHIEPNFDRDVRSVALFGIGLENSTSEKASVGGLVLGPLVQDGFDAIDKMIPFARFGRDYKFLRTSLGIKPLLPLAQSNADAAQALQ